jgi:hypothetical protein
VDARGRLHQPVDRHAEGRRDIRHQPIHESNQQRRAEKAGLISLISLFSQPRISDPEPETPCLICGCGLYWRTSPMSGGPGAWSCSVCDPALADVWQDAPCRPWRVGAASGGAAGPEPLPALVTEADTLTAVLPPRGGPDTARPSQVEVERARPNCWPRPSTTQLSASLTATRRWPTLPPVLWPFDVIHNALL